MFVGRLDASQKGFDVLLDALELAERTKAAHFSAWLVGGARHETEVLLADIANRPILAAMHSAGRLMLWGRVDIDCLPELMSRTSLVVMPSRRETFGLVAVQAMLCRVPVAASYVGGLRHTVVHRETGIHFAPEDAMALAFIIIAQINNRLLTDWLGHRAGQWALEAFGNDSPDGGLRRILKVQDGLQVGEHPIEHPEVFFRRDDERKLLEWLDPDTSLEPIAAQNGSAFRAVHSSGEVSFVKAFTDRPDNDLSRYRLESSLLTVDWRARLHRIATASVSPVTVPLRGSSGRLARFGWVEPEPQTPHAMLALAQQLGADMGMPSRQRIDACNSAFCCLVACPRWEELAEFDRTTAQLNASLTGNAAVFVRCDPRVEIVRLRLHATTGCWPLEPSTLASMLVVLDEAEKRALESDFSVRLCHGALTPHHGCTISGRPVLCDLEEMRYAFGDLDTACLALATLKGGATMDAIQILCASNDLADAAAAALWLVAQALHQALGDAVWGRLDAVDEAVRQCAGLLQAMADIRPR